MTTLRVHGAWGLVGELVLTSGRVQIGDLEDDDIRLGSFGLTCGPEDGGLLEQRPEGWVFHPRAGGMEVRLKASTRLAVGGETALELFESTDVDVVDVDSLPPDETAATPVPPSRPAPGSAAERLRRLGALLQDLQAAAGSDEGLAHALENAFDVVDAQHAVVATVEADGRRLCLIAARGLDGGDPRSALSRSVLDMVLEHGQDVITSNAPVEILTQSTSLQDVRAICALPLQVGGEVRGVLYVDRGYAAIPFTEEDIAFLQLLAALAARCLEGEERLLVAESARRALERRLARQGGADAVRLTWASPLMQRVEEAARRLLPALQGHSLPVLITGESGTGKEVLARWLHAHLPEPRGPFVAVNCAAIPHDLAESELFGIEKGVASGVLRRLGRFQQADGGTLFLDEIGAMPPAIQSKVLRVLESHTIVRVGGRDEIHVQVRILSATNADLRVAIREGTFREDLFWRLCGVELQMPPLRERREDIPFLAREFVAGFAREMGLTPPRFERDVLAQLTAYSWPGNVRELRQRMGALTALSVGGAIRSEDLPSEDLSPVETAATAGASAAATLRTLKEVEIGHIRQVLAAVGGNRARAADILGVHRKTISRRLRDSEAP